MSWKHKNVSFRLTEYFCYYINKDALKYEYLKTNTMKVA
jgi:hypothetical protein